jgi:hypothetical protein
VDISGHKNMLKGKVLIVVMNILAINANHGRLVINLSKNSPGFNSCPSGQPSMAHPSSSDFDR